MPILLPPLNRRRSDIPLIDVHLLDKFNRRFAKSKQLTPQAMRALQAHGRQGGTSGR